MTTAIATQPRTGAELREEERKKRSSIDKQILKYARLSLEEISVRVGLEPFEVQERLDNLLRARDHLSERQQERLLIIEMGELIDQVRERMQSATEDNFADIANVALRGYEAISKRLDAQRKLTELDIAQITKAQGDFFLMVMIESISQVATWLEELHPDLEFDIRQELEEGFAIALPKARDVVNGQVRE